MRTSHALSEFSSRLTLTTWPTSGFASRSSFSAGFDFSETKDSTCSSAQREEKIVTTEARS